MKTVGELVQKLRAYSNVSLYTREMEARELLAQAADMIEELSENTTRQDMKPSKPYENGDRLMDADADLKLMNQVAKNMLCMIVKGDDMIYVQKSYNQ